MKPKTMICVGNKAALALYKKQDWWKSYIKNVLAQTYCERYSSTTDQNDREVKRRKLRMLFCNSSTGTLKYAFLWRKTTEGHDFWQDKIQKMRSFDCFRKSDKYVYTYPLKDLFFLP